jgi:hypothetical protein
MLYRSVPKNRVNLVLYRVMVVCGRIFIDGFLGVIHPALPTSRFRDRRHAYRTPADEDGSIGSKREMDEAETSPSIDSSARHSLTLICSKQTSITGKW